MSTMRYSGQIAIRVTYIEKSIGGSSWPNGGYRCFLKSGQKRTTMYVGAPAVLSHAVDSPEAFDDAARAAIAFADAEWSEWGDLARRTDQGFAVWRQAFKAHWPIVEIR